MAKKISIVFTILVSLALRTSGQEKIMVCKDIRNAFTGNNCERNGSHASTLQGPPGKTGPRGVQGFRGLPGMQGVPGIPAAVDYNRISNMTESKIRDELEEVNQKVDLLQSKVTELMESAGRRKRCKSEDGFFYNERCYIAPYMSRSVDMSYNQAVENCSSLGALLAEIYSLCQQRAIHGFFRTRVPSSTTSIHLWIGNIYQSSENNLRFRSGKEVSTNQFKWHSGYPSGSNSKIAIAIRNDDLDQYKGIYNHNSNSAKHGVICENPI